MALFNLPVMILSDRTAPVISGTSVGNPVSLDENVAATSLVATMTDDGTAVSYAIVSGNTNGDFAIANNGDITVVNSPDYETTSSYSLGITAADALGNTSAPFTVTININDLDEIPPTLLRTTLHTSEISETITSDTLIAEYTASDEGVDVTANIFISTNPSNAFFVQYSSGTMKLYATSSIPNVVTNQYMTVTLSVVDAVGNVANYNQSVKIIDSTSFTGATLMSANSSFSLRDLTRAEQMVKVGSNFYGWESGLDNDNTWVVSTSGNISSQSTISHTTYSSGQLGYAADERWIKAVFSDGSHLFGITSDWVIYRASGSSWVQVGQVGNWVNSLPYPKGGTFMHNGVLYVQTDTTTSGDWKKVTGVTTSSAGSYQSSAFSGTVLYNSTSITTSCDDCTVVTVAGLDYLLLNKSSYHVMVIQLDLGQYFGTVKGLEDWENLEAQTTGADHDNALVADGSYIYTPGLPNEVWRWDVSNINLSERGANYQATDIPTITSGSASFSIIENTSTSTVLSTYVASGATPITWSVTGTDAANFNINSSGELTFANSPDYETVADRSQSINVVATNQFGSASQAVAVTVTNDTSDDGVVYTNSLAGSQTYSLSSVGSFFTISGHAGQRTDTASYPGTYTLTVDADLSVRLEVKGAGGGGNSSSIYGKGGLVTGDYTLLAGSTYHVLVGSGGHYDGNGGFGGGGGGGSETGSGANGTSYGKGGMRGGNGTGQGGGGGGCSGVFITSISHSNALIVAGGGGGGADRQGGHGGGNTGQNGTSDGAATGGGGGTQSAGGSGGGQGAGSGNTGRGGGGGVNYDEGGAGGGGGYYGGGGGGADAPGNDHAGGGGGSGYYNSSAVTLQTWVQGQGANGGSLGAGGSVKITRLS